MRETTIISNLASYKDKLYRYALKILGNTYDAEDVFQELMIKVWNKKEEFKELTNQEAWCMTVIRNLSIDKLRGKKQNYQDISEHYDLSDNGATPDKITEDREELSQVMTVLNSLPPHQKEIIHLRDVEGYTYREIAELIELTEDQVKVNLYRARQRFKDELIKHNYQR